LSGRGAFNQIGAIIALAVWTTAGTFMLLFLAALQDIPEDVEEVSAGTRLQVWDLS
jgi:multiple sugar transport system permease protein